MYFFSNFFHSTQRIYDLTDLYDLRFEYDLISKYFAFKAIKNFVFI